MSDCHLTHPLQATQVSFLVILNGNYKGIKQQQMMIGKLHVDVTEGLEYDSKLKISFFRTPLLTCDFNDDK